MVSRSEIIAEARTWLGTPFHHQGRLKGVGVDCAGVVIGVAKALGLSDFDTTAYPRIPSAEQLRRALDANMESIFVQDAKEGDVLVFCFDREEQHVGFLSDVGIIHSYSQVKKCVEHSLDATWKSRIRGAYRFRGIA